MLYASEDDVEVPTLKQSVPVGVDPATGQPIMGAVEIPAGKSIAETGWYEHGEYPFVFDRLFPVKGTPFGFGYVDVCKHPQEQIDLLDQALTLNALMNAIPRYMMRDDCGINEQEFADWRKGIVHATGSMTEDNLRPVTTPILDDSVIAVINNKISNYDVVLITESKDAGTFRPRTHRQDAAVFKAGAVYEWTAWRNK